MLWVPAGRSPLVTVSVIIPTLNEEAHLGETLRCARQAGAHEIIVVDGGSTDRTRAVARPLAEVVLSATRGRATQMNAGATRASGDILLFLHADTRLPADGVDAVRRACRSPAIVGGRFDVELVPATPLLRLTGWLMNWRSRISRIATGDQAIFVQREIFERLGGYAEIPLMEDIELSRRLKRSGRVACLRQRVSTSARRWQTHGVVKTILLMWTLRTLYWLGVAPVRLRRLYDDTR